MFKKIYKEIDDFSSTINEVEGCDKMLTYVNSDIYSSIKLLMFASKSFSLYGRMMLFFIISLTGLLVFSSLNIGSLNIPILLITLILFVGILTFVTHFKKALILSINNIKSSMSKTDI